VIEVEVATDSGVLGNPRSSSVADHTED